VERSAKFGEETSLQRLTTKGFGSRQRCHFWRGCHAELDSPRAGRGKAGVPLLYSGRVDVRATHVADKNGELSLAAGAAKSVGKFMLAIPDEARAECGKRLEERRHPEVCRAEPWWGWISKCWPPERFGELARRLFSEGGMRSVINYGPGEEGLAKRVVDVAGPSAAVSYSGSFGELMAILRGADCVVVGDTGPLHLADALGARVVAIFGPTDPQRNGPYLGRRENGKGNCAASRECDVNLQARRCAAPVASASFSR